MARRSILIVNSCCPESRSIRTSLAPGVDLIMRATCSDSLRNSSRSSPKILTATCERTPVTISSTRCAIGCDMTILTPGITVSALRISSSIACWVRPDPSKSRSTIGSDSFCEAGSAGDSPRPSFETTDLTPGMAAISFMASASNLIDCSTEMEGARMLTGVTEPSFIIGINDLPRSGNRTNAIASELNEIIIVFF